MLDLMRKHAKNWLVKILLGLIIIVFIFYFGSLRESDKADTIATIDGKVISYADFQHEYENLIDLYRNRFSGNLSNDLLKGLRLKEQAVDNLIKQAIVLEQAKFLNIYTSDEEVRSAILSYPAFQGKSGFDQRIYEQTLRQNKMTPENFEHVQRNFLITKKIQDLLITGIHVSEREVFDLYRFQKEKINVTFLKLATDNFRGEVKPTRQALESYLKEHGKELRIPDQIQVKYLFFPASEFASSVKVTEADIGEYYERNKEKMAKSSGKVLPINEVRDTITNQLQKIRGMQLAAEEAKKAHDIIYQKENFDAFAGEKGLKIYMSALFSANNIPQEFRTIADFQKNMFPLQKNELGRVLSNDKGYYLFQVAAKKSSYIPDLKEAEKEIEGRYITHEAKLLCQKDAESILARLKKGEDLEKIAKEKHTKMGETGLFLPGASVPELGASPELADILAQISNTRPYPDKVLQVNNNAFVLRFKERGKLDDSDFQAKKEQLKKFFLELKQKEALDSWIEGLKNSLIKEGRLKIKKEIKDI